MELVYIIGVVFVVGFGMGELVAYFTMKYVARRYTITPKRTLKKLLTGG